MHGDNPRWVELVDPDEDELVRQLPDTIHTTALEALLAPHVHSDEPRPRIDSHDEYVLGIFLLPVAVTEEDRVYYQEVDFVATHEKLVTVVKTPPGEHPFDTGQAKFACKDHEEIGMYVYHLVDQVAERYLGKIANDQNEVMKRLTMIASLLLVPTFIVGLYGQNFHHIPEIGWAWGYWWAWGWIVGTTIIQVAFFRWKRWL
jgi:Mg2+ and Co2+ transporter CorA